MTRLVSQGEDPLGLSELKFTRTAEESMAINQQKGSAIIIAASGMCNAGRIKHHLKHNLWRPGAQIVITGFQAEGTLGRAIVDGARKVRIFQEDVVVKAKVHTINGITGVDRSFQKSELKSLRYSWRGIDQPGLRPGHPKFLSFSG
jgi:metallo-beta-lactamase family protein